MLLILNGGRGATVPLIATVGDFAYAITGPGTNAAPHPLNLQLKASGDISVAANILTITSVISQSGARSINKTGAGRLILGGANTFSGIYLGGIQGRRRFYIFDVIQLKGIHVIFNSNG